MDCTKCGKLLPQQWDLTQNAWVAWSGLDKPNKSRSTLSKVNAKRHKIIDPPATPKSYKGDLFALCQGHYYVGNPQSAYCAPEWSPGARQGTGQDIQIPGLTWNLRRKKKMLTRTKKLSKCFHKPRKSQNLQALIARMACIRPCGWLALDLLTVLIQSPWKWCPMISPLDQPGHWPMQHSRKSNPRNSHIDWCNLGKNCLYQNKTQNNTLTRKTIIRPTKWFSLQAKAAETWLTPFPEITATGMITGSIVITDMHTVIKPSKLIKTSGMQRTLARSAIKNRDSCFAAKAFCVQCCVLWLPWSAWDHSLAISSPFPSPDNAPTSAPIETGYREDQLWALALKAWTSSCFQLVSGLPNLTLHQRSPKEPSKSRRRRKSRRPGLQHLSKAWSTPSCLVEHCKNPFFHQTRQWRFHTSDNRHFESRSGAYLSYQLAAR